MSERDDEYQEALERRQKEWSDSRPNTYLMGPIDPRSVYPSYPERESYRD